ncbi:hypothetical protein SynWH8101_2050 [Synechococcus sp. WH 8101]|nr:hypothetical protein SynWH8101_2050 [Synechococcus sp. WH 8101]
MGRMGITMPPPMDRPASDMPGTASAEPPELTELITQLDQDRAWLLEQIDRGRWSDLRLDLAALERELGQLLAKASERLDPTT